LHNKTLHTTLDGRLTSASRVASFGPACVSFFVRRKLHIMKSLVLILMLVATGVQAQTHPSFQLDPDAKRKLVQKAAALEGGDSYQTVTNALGSPSLDQRYAQKEGDKRIMIRSLKYYAVIWEKGGAGSWHDESIDVSLDEKNRVRSVRINVTLE